MTEPDVVVIGAGHNGLVCAAYLARAGLDVLVLEARSTVGGCASTVDALGARVNICNCDHTLIRSTTVVEELGLAAHGLRYLDVDPTQLAIPADGSPPWFSFHDVERTLESLRLTHPAEVDGYRRYVKAARPVARLVLDLGSTRPRAADFVGVAMTRHAAAIPRLLTWSRLSAAAVLRQFFSSDALIGPALAVGPSLWGVAPETPGTGLGALTYATRHLVPVGRPEGGSGALPAALAAAITAGGGQIRTDARVTTLHCDGERIRGVELAGGEMIDARRVVSATDPRTTFVRWLSRPPARASATVARWRAAAQVPGYEAKVDAVVDAAPAYTAIDERVQRALGVPDPLIPTAVITAGSQGIGAAHAAASAGRVGDQPVLLANVPSVADATMRTADGGHVFSLEVLFTPHDLRGGWPGSAEPERWLELYARHVQPGFLDRVRRWRVMTPPDYELEFQMAKGHAPSFGGGPLAAFLGRDPELTRYRAPIEGLYLSGAGTFPGAGIWGVSGRNAAAVVLRDL